MLRHTSAELTNLSLIQALELTTARAQSLADPSIIRSLAGYGQTRLFRSTQTLLEHDPFCLATTLTGTKAKDGFVGLFFLNG